ncbi:hypothetical protein PIB30_087126 [Stylosanthes scabra]|uniref:Uncharacterized protein n=1 Tax=Stylosanthes scabra TaxID=79078 RepID=A0ABU6SUM7_9FABA|nr:hypothetical protein [Stylosanthes scabra]
MADPQPNNRQAIPREDENTASNSNSGNGRRGRADQATSARRASSQRVASQIHIPRRDGEHRNTHDLMGIVTRQLCHLDRLENDLARQREIEHQLHIKWAWRKETEEKLRKMEAELKRKETNKAIPHHSDLLFTTGDPFSEEIM